MKGLADVLYVSWDVAAEQVARVAHGVHKNPSRPASVDRSRKCAMARRNRRRRQTFFPETASGGRELHGSVSAVS